MKVRDLTPFLSDPLVEGAVEREFTGITHDSRRVTPGMLFVAAPGLQQDGGAFMASAVERGASVVLCARDAAATSCALAGAARSTRAKGPMGHCHALGYR